MPPWKRLWTWLLPDDGDALVRARAGLVVATCLGLMAATLALILTWLISGDLQLETVGAGLVLALLLAGLIALARGGRVSLATWLLVALLALLTTLDAAAFGLGSPASAGYLVPIVLAACGLGLWAGLGAALLGSAAVWLVAVGASAGWYEPYILFDESHLTFNAPFYTVIFCLVALLAGSWSQHLGAIAQSQPVDHSRAGGP